jgi:hypothetical protein
VLVLGRPRDPGAGRPAPYRAICAGGVATQFTRWVRRRCAACALRWLRSVQKRTGPSHRVTATERREPDRCRCERQVRRSRGIQRLDPSPARQTLTGICATAATRRGEARAVTAVRFPSRAGCPDRPAPSLSQRVPRSTPMLAQRVGQRRSRSASLQMAARQRRATIGLKGWINEGRPNGQVAADDQHLSRRRARWP